MMSSRKWGQRILQLIVFDLGHVLVDFEWEDVCRGFYRRAGLEKEEFSQVLARLGRMGYETGRVSTGQFLAEVNRLLHSNLGVEEFTVLWNATFRENQTMAGLLSRLKERYPLYLLSNTNENHYGYIKDNFNIERHFQETILSYEVGSAKPDKKIYMEVFSRSGVQPGDCLFVDDLEDNIAAARTIGMQAILFEGPDHLEERLVDNGVL